VAADQNELPPLDPSWLNDRSEFQLNFIHGLRNPVGLHLQYRIDGDRVVTDYTPGDRHMAFPGFAHGGLIIAVLDDAMGRCAAVRRRWVVTARLDSRFRSGAPIGVRMRIEAWITRFTARAMHASGRALLDDGTVVAEADGTFLPVTAAMRATMVQAWPGFEAYLDK
jgi:acyl-coenzyme A thioesterase PaaI-like protein